MYYSWSELEHTNVSELLGKVVARIDNRADELHFHTEEGEHYIMYHEQDCCEHVELTDINGDLVDLIGEPILMAEESVSYDEPTDSYEDSETWTFYKLATIKGTVVLRWHGSSNGYYSESVDFAKVREGVE